MDENRATHRIDMRITGIQQRRIELLMKKKGVNKSSVVNEAIKQMFDREIGLLPEEGKKKK